MKVKKATKVTKVTKVTRRIKRRRNNHQHNLTPHLIEVEKKRENIQDLIQVQAHQALPAQVVQKIGQERKRNQRIQSFMMITIKKNLEAF